MIVCSTIVNFSYELKVVSGPTSLCIAVMRGMTWKWYHGTTFCKDGGTWCQNKGILGTQPILVSTNNKNSQNKCVAVDSSDGEISVAVSFFCVVWSCSLVSQETNVDLFSEFVMG